MVNESYHTKSTPRVVDGWLGFMVGAAKWFPLWDASQLENTAAELAKLIGNNAKVADEKSMMEHEKAEDHDNAGEIVAVRQPSTSLQPVTVRHINSTDLATAWSIISDSTKSKYPTFLPIYLDEIGLHTADGLSSLSTRQLYLLVNLFKPIIARNLTKLFHLNDYEHMLQQQQKNYKDNSNPYAAWKILKQIKYHKFSLLSDIIQELGLNDAQDLHILEIGQIFILGMLLKAVPQQEYLYYILGIREYSCF